MAAEISQINGQAWDAVMLNGVVADVKSAGCYKPSEPRADADGNTEAGCGPNDEWMMCMATILAPSGKLKMVTI